jgi:hypothetical protein
MQSEETKRLVLLRTAPLNKWIALSKDESEIVAIGDSFQDVSEQCDRDGLVHPLIVKTSEIWAALAL